MHLEELQSLIAKGETEFLEFKKSTGQRTEAAKTVCAFLNGLGGILLFGITDKGEVVGQQVVAKTLEDISFELRKIEPPAFPEIKTIPLGRDKAVIAIHIQGSLGTYRYDGRPYLRHGPTTQIMPHEEYEKRILDKFHSYRRWENEAAPEWISIQDLDEEEIQNTLQNAIQLGRMKKPIQTDSKSILRGLGLMSEGRLINAAIALYGKSEKLFSCYPQLSIRLARFRGSDRLTGFMDNRNYWGHAFDLLRRGELFLLDHVPISGRVVPGKIVREDYPLYPPLATREAIANAISHRDYTAQGGSVAIAIYDNHLEIINPGIFHFGMTPEKLSLPHESKPWNPIIASVLYRAGIIEKWGMGTLNIVDWCQGNGNPTPRWIVQTESIVTTFLPSRFFATGKTLKEHPTAPARPESLEDKILDLLHRGPQSKTALAKNLGHKQISGGLKKILHDLLQKKIISCTLPEKPNSRLQRYQLTQAYNPETSKPESRPDQKPELRPESLEDKIVDLLHRGPQSKTALAKNLGHKQISGGLKKILHDLLQKKIISCTLPEKPNSRLQQYQLTQAYNPETSKPESRPGPEPKPRPESLEGKILDLLHHGPQSKAALAQNLGHKQVSGGLKKTLHDLLQKKIISCTLPEKPNSRLQQYQLTRAYNPETSKPESRPESLEDKILDLLHRGPQSKTALAKNLGHKQISGGLKKILHDLLQKKIISCTLPEKPNSRLQQYQLTQAHNPETSKPESRPESKK